jgi:hypothetical protein
MDHPQQVNLIDDTTTHLTAEETAIYTHVSYAHVVAAIADGELQHEGTHPAHQDRLLIRRGEADRWWRQIVLAQ